MDVKLIVVLRLQGLFIVLILAVLSPRIFAGPAFTFSEAKIDISPPQLLPLGGYTARHGELMEEGGQPLYARCILFQYGDLPIALVSAEMLTIPDSLAAEVRKSIPSNVRLFLSATHTHSAPDSQMMNDHMTFSVPGIATFKPRWLKWYGAKIASVVSAAMEAPRQEISKLQVVQFDEALNRGRRLKAKPDELATVLEAISSGLPQELLLEYAAHAVFHGPERNQTSGDWPAEVSSRMESTQLGTVFPVLEGAIGDVSPSAPGLHPSEKIANFTNTIMGGFEKAKKRPLTVWQGRDRVGTVRCVQQWIQMDPAVPSRAFIANYHLPKELAQIMVREFAPASAQITAIRFGSMAIVGVPGEPTSHLGRTIRAAGLLMGFKSVLVISHVNGWIGYELDPKDYARGGYEASLSFNGPQEGEHVVVAAIKALKELTRRGG